MSLNGFKKQLVQQGVEGKLAARVAKVLQRETTSGVVSRSDREQKDIETANAQIQSRV